MDPERISDYNISDVVKATAGQKQELIVCADDVEDLSQIPARSGFHHIRNA